MGGSWFTRKALATHKTSRVIIVSWEWNIIPLSASRDIYFLGRARYACLNLYKFSLKLLFFRWSHIMDHTMLLSPIVWVHRILTYTSNTFLTSSCLFDIIYRIDRSIAIANTQLKFTYLYWTCRDVMPLLSSNTWTHKQKSKRDCENKTEARPSVKLLTYGLNKTTISNPFKSWLYGYGQQMERKVQHNILTLAKHCMPTKGKKG